MKTILIVEDDAEVQELLTDYIKLNSNYKTIVAEDGEVALDIINENQPDLILVDMLLPKIGGVALFYNLRKLEKAKDTPVIFMSGALKDEVFKHEGIEMGAINYVTKPLNLESLLKKIENALEGDGNT